MRKMIWLIAVLVVLWSLWWGIAASVLRSGLEGWFDARRAEGWQAEATFSSSGYPDRLITRIDALQLADPQTGVAITAPDLTFSTAAWWPGYAEILLPDQTIRLAAPDAYADLTMAEGLMRLDLVPGTRLELQHLAWTAGPWGLTSDAGDLVSAQNLTIAMTQADAPELYHFDVEAGSLRPGSVLRTRLAVPYDWPVTLQSFKLDMDVTFDRAWDRFSIEQRRPQPRVIMLNLAEAQWGGLRMNIAADLTVDPAGTPSGTVSIQAENWQDMLRLAQSGGILPAPIAQQAERVLGQFASLSGNPGTIDIKLTLRDGLILLGFIPLGPAPRIQLR